MKKALSLCLIFLLGCYPKTYSLRDNPQQTKETQKITLPFELKTSEELENLLVKDAADGKLDIPYERAVLIATETEPLIIDYYEQKIDDLAKRMGEQIKNVSSEYDKARIIFNSFGKEFTSKDGMYKLGNTLTTKTGNCISLSVLFDIVCSKNRINTSYMATFDHVFNIVDGKFIDLTSETGEPESYNLEDETLLRISRLDILARLYTSRAANFIKRRYTEKAEEMFKKGLAICPSDKLTLDNLIQMYYYNRRFDDALKWLEKYMKYYPNEEGAQIYKNRILEKKKS